MPCLQPPMTAARPAPAARPLRRPRWRHACGTAGLLALAVAGGGAEAASLRLHVPSPDWRDQVLYFALTDRFADGDPGNNDFGAGEFNRQSAEHYQGGDLKGLTRHLDYIRGLGATGLWITPPVANQWLSPGGHSAGYHGYWAEDFTRLDPHVGTLADYRQLSDHLHRRGMVLVQDIVVNHTGDYFWYQRDAWRPDDPVAGYHANADTPPTRAPRQWPFSLNDPRRPADRRAGVYHWTPDIVDYADPQQALHWQMAGLDDLNTENPLVRRALRKSYGQWIRQVGVDGFRVDTAFYVPPAFFTDFLHARDPAAPGIARVAAATGRRDFFSFGEGFGIDRPGEVTQTRKIASYTGPQRLGGMLNFPLYGALGEVFARGRPAAELGGRITQMMALHHDPHRLPSFVDNHDVDRFLAGSDEAGLRQALLALMTLPGVPVIYYGTEQGLRLPRPAMFAAGQGSGGTDHYDTQAPLYRYLREAIALRTGSKLFTRGRPSVLYGEPGGPGALAWRTDRAGQSALVVFNTAAHEVLLDHLATGLLPGTRLRGRFGLQGTPEDLVVQADGRVHLRLPARGGQVWLAQRRAAAVPRPGPDLQIQPLPAGPLTGPVQVQGRSEAPAPFQLVLDGRLDQAQTVTPDGTGRWQATLDTARLGSTAAAHRLVAWRSSDGALSEPASFQFERPWQVLADLDDPADDDHGPTGRYTYPTDPSYAGLRSMDLRHVQVLGAGGELSLRIDMAALNRSWNPPQGFDHLALTLFIELPGEPGGSTRMPQQDGSLPGDMRWHRRLRVHGWSNALFSAEGATADHEGRPLSPAASVQVDAALGRITLTLPAESLGYPTSLHGARLYLTTWDFDGGYRPLQPAAQNWAMGSGATGPAPKVMDDTPVITLP